MYEALWTNGPKECLEFFDHTFDDHFGCALPMYMPRQLILDYILARCTKDNDHFFDQVKFNTSVKSVTFHDEFGKFVVQTMDPNETTTSTDESSVSVTERLFDKCLWAAGNNGTPNIPPSISNALSLGGFQGRVMHSSMCLWKKDTDHW
jgi:cation diffusion facilitator CzcD-associated flavoprotein CzcO